MKSERVTPSVPTDTGRASAAVWGPRFRDPLAEGLKRFLASVDFDHALAWADIAGSIAHVTMLAHTGTISEADRDSMVDGLRRVWAHISTGQADLSPELEDVHMNVEALLRQEVGDVADMLHAGRSRNDQVALDLRLYVREHLARTMGGVVALQEALLELASGPEGPSAAIVAGHTHLQPAQPVLLAHVMLAHFERLQRDLGRLSLCFDHVDHSPLGAGALAGTGLPIDPSMTADLLGFKATFANSLDAVSDRDFVFEALASLSLLAIHLSGLCEEMVLWCSHGFGWAQMSDATSTGSSMMPQKRNPDVFELVRGKAGRVLGHLVSMGMVLKGLPLAYNKDLQEDKEATFDAFATVEACLGAMVEGLGGLTMDPGKVRIPPEAMSTDLVEHLVKKGVPFREAYRAVGSLVLWCDDHGVHLDDVDPDTLKDLHADLDAECLDLLTPEGSVRAKTSPGGTGPDQVTEALARAWTTVHGNQIQVEVHHAPTLKARALLKGTGPDPA